MAKQKTCTKCGRRRRIKFFSKNQARCKACQHEIRIVYSATVNGKIQHMWDHMNYRVKSTEPRHIRYRGIKVLLTRSEFKEWATGALAIWITHMPLKEATIDRINDPGHYELGNLQLITQRDQNLKRECCKNVHAEPGTAWCGGCKKYHPMSEFGKCTAAFNGLQGYCKAYRKANKT